MDSGLISQILSKSVKIRHLKRQYQIKKFVDWELRQAASKLRSNIIEKNKYAGFLPLGEARIRLMQAGDIPVNFNEELKKLQKEIESSKIKLYNLRHDDKKLRTVRRDLEESKADYLSFLIKLHSLDYLTVEGYADDIVARYVIQHNCNRKINYLIADKLVDKYNMSLPNYVQIRQVAKSQDWRNMWMAKKEDLFEKDLDDLQIQLIAFSRMYDSVYENMETPEDFVIKDDDMLDGWLLEQKKNRDKDKLKKSIDDKIPANAQEVFITPKDDEDRQRINDLNDEQALMFKKRREQIIKKHGFINEGKLRKDYKLKL